jgi:hypothetical protein
MKSWCQRAEVQEQLLVGSILKAHIGGICGEADVEAVRYRSSCSWARFWKPHSKSMKELLPRAGGAGVAFAGGVHSFVTM